MLETRGVGARDQARIVQRLSEALAARQRNALSLASSDVDALRASVATAEAEILRLGAMPKGDQRARRAVG